MDLRRPRKAWFYCLAALLVLLAVPAIGELRGLSGWRSVCPLEFSRDGQKLVAGLSTGRSYNEDYHWLIADVGQTIALFDAHTGKRGSNPVQLRHSGPYSGIPSTPLGHFIAFSSDGPTLAVASWDGTVQLWDWQTMQLKETLRSQLQHLTSVAFSARGRHLVAGGRSGLWIWNVQSPGDGSYLESNCMARQIASMPDSAVIAVGGRHCEWIELLDCESGLKTRVDPAKSIEALSISFSPDGHSMVIGGTESVLMWDFKGQARRFEVDSHWTQGVAFSPDGEVLTAAGPQGLKSWSTATGQPIDGIRHHHQASSLAYSPDGTLLAVGGHAGDVGVWEMGTNRLLWSGQVAGPFRGAGPFSAATGIVFVILIALTFRHAAAFGNLAGTADSPSPVPRSGEE